MKIAGPPRRRRYRSERSQFSSPIRRPRREWLDLRTEEAAEPEPDALADERADHDGDAEEEAPPAGDATAVAGDDHDGVARHEQARSGRSSRA